LILALRVEWAKAKARADRWEEEVVLLDEEMRQVQLMFCEWKEAWWKEQSSHRVDLPDELSERLCAYAEEQAATEVAMAKDFDKKWSAVRRRAQPIIAKFWGLALDDSDGMDIAAEDGAEEQVVIFVVGEEDDNDGGGSDYKD
jgi:hypothetical protein